MAVRGILMRLCLPTLGSFPAATSSRMWSRPNRVNFVASSTFTVNAFMFASLASSGPVPVLIRLLKAKYPG